MRKFFKYSVRTVLILIIVIGAIHAVSAFTWDRRVRYTEISYSSPKISPELNGYVMAFIVDTHEISDEDLQRVADNISARNVDVLLLGGDFADTREQMLRGMEILSRVHTKDGIYGVDGNHDKFWELSPAMQQFGIVALDNAGVTLHEGLYLAGVQDEWVRRPDVAKAVSSANPVDFIVLLSHNPDVSMRQDMSRVDLMLSGHYHGGHVTLFGLWAPALWPSPYFTDYGHKFMKGWAKGNNGVDVFVSAGTGYRKTPRVFAPPQVVYVTLLKGSL